MPGCSCAGQFVNCGSSRNPDAGHVIRRRRSARSAGTFSYVIDDTTLSPPNRGRDATERNRRVIAHGLSSSDRVVTTALPTCPTVPRSWSERTRRRRWPISHRASATGRTGPDGQVKDGQARIASQGRAGRAPRQARRAPPGDADQSGQTAPAQGNGPSGSGAKPQP